MSFIKKLEKFQDPNIRKILPTITVSGLSGSGKSTFAKALAKELGPSIEYVSAGRFQREAAEKHGMSITQFSEKLAQGDDKFDLMTDKESLKYAQKGGFVIDGRISGFVAGNFADARFLIFVTDMKVVAQRVFERDRTEANPGETLKLLKRRDDADRIRYKKFYNISLDDKSIYPSEHQIDNTKLTKEELIASAKHFSVILKKDFDF
ncbi:MAG: cytidylate kinase family protein [Candidatus Hermodarchaeota archaeon]